MINFRKIQGYIHGSRFRLTMTLLSYPIVGMCLGKRDAGFVPFEYLYLLPVFMAHYSIANILNGLCDFEAKIDEKETSNDRTMFDYGLTSKDIWNFVYFDIAVMYGFSYLAFSKFSTLDLMYVFAYISFGIFLAIYYNLPPLRLKTKFFGAESTIFLIFVVQVNLSYFLITGDSSFSTCFIHFPGSILQIWDIMMNLYVDSEEDKRDGSRSIPIVMGDKFASSLIILTPILGCYLTYRYSVVYNNMYTCLPLLTIPLIYFVISLACKKQKRVKPYYFLTLFLYNTLFAIGLLMN
ncbi:hypothetical protein CYY_008014 [Polysphondylium violaceum]|uniref:UbiA prenyltransferase family protein n=1 Tax=Polysphondylium violaceum TaxID=133409 RepID=A0A8J4PR14_9MYCE|nr:hypothetical protein CYY_008014 [Polysphondylium violaceum]